MTAILRARDLAWAPPGVQQPVFAQVDVEVRPGELIALLGRSGSGKSLLVSCLAGLRAPSRGSVELSHGRRPTPDEVVAVFQNPDHQFVAARLDRELAFGLEVRGADPAAMRRAVVRAAEGLGLAGRLEASPAQLSLGQRQRLALSAATIAGPRFLLADEPTSHLDWRARATILADLRDRARQGCGVVLVTQFPDEAVLADRVWVLEEGRLSQLEPRELHRISGWPQTDLARLAARAAAAGVRLPAYVTDAEALAREWSEPAPLPTAARTRGVPVVAWRDACRFRHPGGEQVLEIRDFEVCRGDRVVLAGESASGKTTLLRALAGDLPADVPVPMADGLRIGFLPQTPERMFYRAIAWEELGVPPHDLARANRAAALLARLGLDVTGVRSRAAFHFSVGEQRRLALAAQILRDPDLLLLDEPTAGLDAPTAAAVCDAIETALPPGTAVVIATHDLGATASLGTRYWLLADGEATACATQRDLVQAVVTKSQHVEPGDSSTAGASLDAGAFFPAWWRLSEAIRARGVVINMFQDNELGIFRGLGAPTGGGGSLC